MTEINWWLETFKILPATVIGVSVAIVALLQWKTAHAKVMLDLFDRRITVYDNVLEAIALSNKFSAPEKPAFDAVLKLYQLRSDASFLFSENIADIITEIISCMNAESRNERQLDRQNLSVEELVRYSNALEYAGNMKDRLGRQFQDACIPYLRIDIKHWSYRERFKRARIALTISICFLLIF